jgi:hypothetical protein
MTTGFPAGRVLRRAYIRAFDRLSVFSGAVLLALLFALVSASFPVPSDSTWVQRLVYDLISAGITAAVAFLAVIGFQLAKYRFNRSYESWHTLASRSGDVWPQLVRQRDGFDEHPTIFGRMECVIRTPSGSIVTVADEQIGLAHNSANAHCPWNGVGTYEVRWYGSKEFGKFYEITRAAHIFPDVTSEHPVGWQLAMTKARLRF